MKSIFLKSVLLTAFFLVMAIAAQAQEKKFKVVQGLSYLHTQVELIIDNWEVHPLSTVDLDKFAAEYKKHFIEEIEHDEEWVEFMLVDENWDSVFGDSISKDVEQALNKNLVFYSEVYELIKTPETFTKKLKVLMKRREKADHRLYHIIFPALIH
ncbi:MAG: hypothetical protein ACPGJS_14505 [Flammeovirgaceae bacterium]